MFLRNFAAISLPDLSALNKASDKWKFQNTANVKNKDHRHLDSTIE